MNRLILIRHASSVVRQVGDIRDYDEPLGEEGYHQAKAVATRLSKVNGTAWSSPQPRAMTTAKMIGKQVVPTPALEDWREGEAVEQMYRRVIGFINGLEGTNIIVSHGSPIALILCHFMGIPPERHALWGIAHASISVIQDGIVIAMNDTTHLGISPEIATYDPHTWTMKG